LYPAGADGGVEGGKNWMCHWQCSAMFFTVVISAWTLGNEILPEYKFLMVVAKVCNMWQIKCKGPKLSSTKCE